MINRWCCEATSGSGDIGSGCYLSMLVISLRPGITRNPEHLLRGTSLGFEYFKQGKYISGDERGGFHVPRWTYPFRTQDLGFSFKGRKIGWRRDSLSQRKKIKEEELWRRDPPPRKWVVHNQTICHHSEEFLLRQVITEGHKCKHGGVHRCPHKIMWCQRNLCGALHTIPPTTTKHGHNWRVCYEKHAKHRSHPIQRGSTWWRQCKYSLWARAPSPCTAGSICLRRCPNLLREPPVED
jgi:hypothetical protein